MQETAHRSFEAPNETRQFPNGRAEIVMIGDNEVGRLVFEPGWRWYGASNYAKSPRSSQE